MTEHNWPGEIFESGDTSPQADSVRGMPSGVSPLDSAATSGEESADTIPPDSDSPSPTIPDTEPAGEASPASARSSSGTDLPDDPPIGPPGAPADGPAGGDSSAEGRWRELAEIERQLREDVEGRLAESERGRQTAIASQLAAQSEFVRSTGSGSLTLSLLLAVESVRRQPTLEGIRALRDGLAVYPQRSSDEPPQASIQAMAVSPDGRRLATAGRDGTARVWSVDDGSELARVDHDAPVWAIAFSPDGRLVVSAGEDGETLVWEASSGHEIAAFHPDGEIGHPIEAVAFSPDGGRVVTGGWDYTARVWSIDDGREVAQLHHTDWVLAVAFSPDGRVVATGSDDGTARVWSASDGREIASLGHESPVLSVAFSPDGQSVVSGDEDGVARVWRADSGSMVCVVSHGEPLEAIAFSSDGERIVTAGRDGSGRVWAVDDGRELTPPPAAPSSGEVSDSQTDSDAAQVAADELAWRTSELMSEACRRLPRNLTREEWSRYLRDEPYHPTCPNLP